MAYRIAAMLMTLSDLQAHSSIVGFFRWFFSYTLVQQLTNFN